MRPTAARLGWTSVLLLLLLLTGCTAPVEVWPPDWHPASPGAADEPPPSRLTALADAEPVPRADEGHTPPTSGSAGHHGHHDHHHAEHAEHEMHAPPPAGDTYVCPMHPDVSSDAPGACPRCGMNLRKMSPRGDK